jgi:hypothetical protein
LNTTMIVFQSWYSLSCCEFLILWMIFVVNFWDYGGVMLWMGRSFWQSCNSGCPMLWNLETKPFFSSLSAIITFNTFLNVDVVNFSSFHASFIFLNCYNY